MTVEATVTVVAGQDRPEPSFVKKQVTLPTGEIVDLEIQSSHPVGEFNLDVENKRVSLAVEGDGEPDTIVIPISRILDGPYTVTIDGQAVDFKVIKNETTGESSMRLQHQLGASKVEIVGTHVVPELTSTLTAMAALMSIVILAAARARPKI